MLSYCCFIFAKTFCICINQPQLGEGESFVESDSRQHQSGACYYDSERLRVLVFDSQPAMVLGHETGGQPSSPGCRVDLALNVEAIGSAASIEKR